MCARVEQRGLERNTTIGPSSATEASTSKMHRRVRTEAGHQAWEENDMAKNKSRVRIIDVQPGDVFLVDGNSGDLVVTKLDDTIGAWCRYTGTGKRTKIQVSRLQREYARAGTIRTARAKRELEEIAIRELDKLDKEARE